MRLGWLWLLGQRPARHQTDCCHLICRAVARQARACPSASNSTDPRQAAVARLLSTGRACANLCIWCGTFKTAKCWLSSHKAGYRELQHNAHINSLRVTKVLPWHKDTHLIAHDVVLTSLLDSSSSCSPHTVLVNEELPLPSLAKGQGCCVQQVSWRFSATLPYTEAILQTGF